MQVKNVNESAGKTNGDRKAKEEEAPLLGLS